MTHTPVPRVKLGSQGLVVSAQGLGCMGMSAFYGIPKPEADMIALMQHAVDSGITFFDTSDIYGPHTNEILVGKALKAVGREKVQLATKFANHIDSNGQWCIRGDPAYVRAACEASLKRLNTDYIDLYYQHRVDTKVPIEVTIGELKKLVEEGKVKYLGLSEANAATIRRAHAVHPITAVQLEWSLWSRDVEDEIIPTCRELGIGIVPYSPLGRGFFSGKAITENLEDGDRRLEHVEVWKRGSLWVSEVHREVTWRDRWVQTMPRFEEDNMAKNKVLYDRVAALAAKKKCTPGQLALAWVQHQGVDTVPIPGTTKVANLDENVAALSISLSKEELDEASNAVPASEVCGGRYQAPMAKFSHDFSDTPVLDSWKGSS